MTHTTRNPNPFLAGPIRDFGLAGVWDLLRYCRQSRHSTYGWMLPCFFLLIFSAVESPELRAVQGILSGREGGRDALSLFVGTAESEVLSEIFASGEDPADLHRYVTRTKWDIGKLAGAARGFGETWLRQVEQRTSIQAKVCRVLAKDRMAGRSPRMGMDRIHGEKIVADSRVSASNRDSRGGCIFLREPTVPCESNVVQMNFRLPPEVSFCFPRQRVVLSS